MVVTVLVAGCEWGREVTFDQTSKPAFSFHYLTQDGTDGYSSAARPGSIGFTAPRTNQGSNTRVVFWPPSQPMTEAHESCATWTSQSDLGTQQGLALRVRHDLPEGRWRAITVMKNVVWGANWQFNVLGWDTRNPSGWTMWGSVNLAPVFWTGQKLKPLPWRVCARVVGEVVTVKGWPAAEAEPAWTDRTHVGRVTIPRGWVYSGKPGWYLGHLTPGASTSSTGMELSRLVAPAPT